VKLPDEYKTHLDHRITVLMTFTLRRDSNWFGPDHGEQNKLGDVYRASLEGAGIMLRMLMEFLGVKANSDSPPQLVKATDRRNECLGKGLLRGVLPVIPDSKKPFETCKEEFLARMHKETSKRTAHAEFLSHGLDPEDLRRATKWVVTEIWNRCYTPDPITIHRDLHCLMNGGKWENIPFQAAKN
jgi:hypothetical protein